MFESNVSTEEQKKHGISVDNQIQALKDYAKEKHYHVVDIYNDAGISARKSYLKRPALNQMVRDCQAGKIDLILMTKLDRFFRSVKDYYTVMEKIGDIPWKAIWEDYETETSAGVFKVNIMLSVAQSEADRTSERIKNTFDYKRAKGEYVGGNKAPIGYKRNGKQLEINPAERPAVNAFFDTFLETFSRRKAIESAIALGVKLNPSTANRLLTHPAYYGGLAYCPEAYITKEQHELIAKNRKRPPKNYTTGYKYIFSGLGICGKCGTHMVAQRTVRTRKDGSKSHSVRYVCNKHDKGYECTGSSMAEKYLEEFLLNQIEAEISEHNNKVIAVSKGTDKKAIANLKAKLKRIKDLYELGDMDFTEYKEKRSNILDELNNLERESMPKIHQLPDNWRELYNSLDADRKRAFWSNLFHHVEINGMCCKTPKIIL